MVLAVSDERELRAVAESLRHADIPHKLIVEPDLPWDGAATAIGVYPVEDRSDLRRILGRLPLLK